MKWLDRGVFIMLSRTIDAWIDIEASPDRIWEVLADFPKWACGILLFH